MIKRKWGMAGSALLASAAILAACSGNNDSAGNSGGDSGSGSSAASGAQASNLNAEGYPIVNDPLTLSVLGSRAAIQGDWDQMVLFQEMEKKTNIHLTFDTPQAASFDEKKNLAFASNELPDLFLGANLTVKEQVMYGSQGVLIPLENLIDQYAPNLKKIFDDNPSVKQSITSLDGHIYALPQVQQELRGLVPRLWINQEWLKNVGMEMPQTVDDLYAVLKAFKEKDPNQNGKADEIPMSFANNSMSMLRAGLLADFGFLTDIGAADPMIVVKDGKVAYAPVEEGYKAYLTFMNKLYKEKLLDQESFSQNPQDMTAKGNNNQLGVFASAGPFLVVKLEDNTKYASLPPLTSSVSDQKMWPKSAGIVTGTFAISNKNPNPEASMRWVDYAYSPEGSIFFDQGPEGLGWKWEDDAHTKWMKPDAPAPYKSTEEYRGGKLTPSAGSLLPMFKSNDFYSRIDLPQANHIIDQVADKYAPYVKDTFPLIYFSDEDQNRLNVLESDIQTYVEQAEAKFITGHDSLDKWDSYVSTINKMGLSEMIDIYQKGYDRWKSVQ